MPPTFGPGSAEPFQQASINQCLPRWARPGIKVPHQKQHGKCPTIIENDLQMKFYVHKCYWMVHSTGWWGGTNTIHPTHVPPARKCAQHEPNSHYDSDYGTAIQWSSGFDLGASLNLKGVNLKASFSSSAQTGYDTNDHMYFNFGHHMGYLCGTNTSEAHAAILVQRSNLP